MAETRTYCDYSASAPIRPEARQMLLEASEIVGNPSSVHVEGRRARALVEVARDSLATAIGACRDELAFTSGGTEAAQASIRGVLAALDGRGALLCSAIEHECVLALPAEQRIGVDGDGVLDLGELEAVAARLAGEGRIPVMSLMLVNNETGVIQPVAEAAAVLHRHGGYLHCDAVQALGRIPVSVVDLDADAVTLSAHKIGGAKGTGAMWLRPSLPFVAQQTGGGQELSRRAGTENLPGVAAFGAALQAATADLAGMNRLASLQRDMETRILTGAPGARILSAKAARAPGITCVSLPGAASETQVMKLDLAGCAVSAGSACSSGKVRPSHVLLAMRAGLDVARCAIRASFGWATRDGDPERFARAYLAMAARLAPQAVSPELIDTAGANTHA